MSSDVGRRLRAQVRDRAYHVCEYCLVHEDDTFWGCQVDHIISLKHRGSTVLDNLAWACLTCNARKGSDIAACVGNPPQLTRLFHPRTDHWNETFQLEGVRIQPILPTGIATETLLRFNEPHRLRERRLLAQTARYPTVEALARMRD